MNKKILLLAAVVILSIVGLYQVFFNEKNEKFSLVEVVRGDISQEIFESGQVRKGEKINLNFKNSGQIQEIYVRVGEEVEAGRELAKLDTTNIDLQLQDARISLELARLNLEKLLAGAEPEEIKIAESQTESTRKSLGVAEENLSSSYGTAVTVLDNSYPPIYNALAFVKEFITNYIIIEDQDSIKITLARDKMETSEGKARLYLETLKSDSGNENIESGLSLMKSSLETAFNNLETIREIVDRAAVYKSNVSATDRALLDTLKTNVNTALTNVVSSQQTISLMKLNIETAESKLQEAENNLALVKAGTSQVDIELYEAQIRQAQVRVQLYENQLKEAKLISPVDAKVVEINKRVGELVQPALSEAVIVLLPIVPYEVKTDIYEEDVVKISVGNPVEISLVAFPDEKIEGAIASINPAEKIIDGVVYYETIIGFNEAPEDIKPGMTADLVIQIGSKENVLVIPREVIGKEGDKTIVEVYKNGSIGKREIEIGLRGSDNMTEIISGLEEGEQVISRK
ncbi:MAG TPA: efflux RND transporter periplasmic adaptor subunit [Patescibacteria group bacterium]|nr:efflux RND transporter periplasmic adaptor subunit [Patescibacteria group bacterium]